jgi:TonB-dependent receptor
MKTFKEKTIQLMFGASMIALGATAALGGVAQAQNTSNDAKADAASDTQEVIVVGVRRSEQSSINRKKRAATAQDSIVADDIGQFPDKNAAEAIARIAGVGLDIDDSGQQGGFTIRGQAADLVRVEVDGMSMLATGNQDGRSVTSVGDMSSDLIKSVDVVKGQTADMTPGGVGGTVRIEQRSGLDFAKPLYKLNLQYQQASLDGTWKPRINAIATNKIFGGRVGLLFNFTYDDQPTMTDFARVSDKQSGYLPLGDYDNSPNKTFTTPYDPIAAAATSKSQCATLPNGSFNTRLNCYAQWEDMVPSLPRMGRGYRDAKRTSFQVRADWKVNNNLTVFASYNPNILSYDSQDFNLQISSSPAGTTNGSGVLASQNIQNVVVNANHYVTQFDMIRGTPAPNISSLNWSTQDRFIHRDDQQHYVQTGADLKWKKWTAKARLQYSFAKSVREDDVFTFVAPIPSATFKMVPENGLWNFTVPASANLSTPQAYYPVLGTNGLSAAGSLEYTPQADKNNELNLQLDMTRRFDHLGPFKNVKFGFQNRSTHNTTYREGGMLVEPGVTLYRARSLDTVQFCLPSAAPASAPCKFGSAPKPSTTITDQLYKTHTLTQQQYQSLIDISLIDLPGGQFFGGMPDRGSLLDSWMTIDFKKFFNMLGNYADLSAHNTDCLYRCLATNGKMYDRPGFSTKEGTFSAYAMTDFETHLFGMEVDGNVGVRYQRIHVLAHPSIDYGNRIFTQNTSGNAGYTISNAIIKRVTNEFDKTAEDILPSFNVVAWPIENELAVRYSAAKQRARPSMVQLTGTAAANCGKIDPAQKAILEAQLAANPALIDDGDPTTDDGTEASNILNKLVNTCTGSIGNPQLKGYGANTQNLSLEWYPNKDSQLSLAVYQIDVESGRPEQVNIAQFPLEGDTYLVSTYQDGPSGLTQKGVEVAGRTAFTFLPSILKYTGAGFNYSTTSSNGGGTVVDAFTGKVLPPRGTSSYVYNLNFWYDDGRLNARVAYQERDFYYDRTDASASINRVPDYAGGANTTGYYKMVSPIFKNGSKSLDARASYKINKNLQVFLEGKNLLNDNVSRFTPDEYREIGGGTPFIFDTYYSGRRIYFGMSAQF